MEKQTCQSRMINHGPWEKEENLDTWEQRGPDRACSFCGSMHPEDFQNLVERATIDDSIIIEPSTKKYKVYIKRFALEGEQAIKFYTWHLTPETTEKINKVYGIAIVESNKRMSKHMDKIMKKMKRDSGGM